MSQGQRESYKNHEKRGKNIYFLTTLELCTVTVGTLCQYWGSEQFYSDPVFKTNSAPNPNLNAFGSGSESKLTLRTNFNLKSSTFY